MPPTKQEKMDTAALDAFLATQEPQPQPIPQVQQQPAPPPSPAPVIETAAIDQFLDTSAIDSFLAEPKPIDSSVTKTESFVRGATQGATFNLGDELTGAVESGIGAIEALLTGKNAFGDESRIDAIRNTLDNYRKSRDTIRKQNEDARLSNPEAFLGGEIAGMVGTSAGVTGALSTARSATTAIRGVQAAKKSTELAKISTAIARSGALGTEAIDSTIKGKRLLDVAKAAAKVGASEGAILGLGGSEAELTPDQINLESAGSAALDTGIAAGTGALFAGGLSALGRAGASGIAKAAETEIYKKAATAVKSQFDKAAESIAETAGNMALRSIKASGSGLKEVRRLFGLDKISELGEDLLNEQVSPLGEKTLKKAVGFKTIAKTVQVLEDNIKIVNNEADNFIATLDTFKNEIVNRGVKKEVAEKAFGVDASEFVSKSKAWVNSKYKSSAEQGIKKDLLNAIDNFQTHFAGKKNLSFAEAVAERRGFQSKVDYFKSPMTKSGAHEQGFAKFSQFMNEAMDSKADDILAKAMPEKRGVYKKIRELQSNFVDAKRIAEDNLIRQSSNNPFSLTELMIGSAAGAGLSVQQGSATTGGLGGIAAAIATKQGRKALPRILAKGANTLAKGLKGNLKSQAVAKAAFGKFAPALNAANEKGTPALLATHLLLYTESEDYRKQIQELDDVE